MLRGRHQLEPEQIGIYLPGAKQILYALDEPWECCWWTIARGEPMREQALAERFAVSCGPIRDVLMQLTQEGMLTAERNCGARVSRRVQSEIGHFTWRSSPVVREFGKAISYWRFALISLVNSTAQMAPTLRQSRPHTGRRQSSSWSPESKRSPSPPRHCRAPCRLAAPTPHGRNLLVSVRASQTPLITYTQIGMVITLRPVLTPSIVATNVLSIPSWQLIT
jgi:hypothetical protein